MLLLKGHALPFVVQIEVLLELADDLFVFNPFLFLKQAVLHLFDLKLALPGNPSHFQLVLLVFVLTLLLLSLDPFIIGSGQFPGLVELSRLSHFEF